VNKQPNKLQKFLFGDLVGNQYAEQFKLAIGSLLAISVFIFQSFLSSPPGTLDDKASHSIIAFAVAIPVLGTYLLLLSLSTVHRMFSSTILTIFLLVGIGTNAYGTGQAFWHLSELAANVFSITVVICFVVLIAFIGRTEEKGTQSS
jgi:hypothetical protein